MRFSTPRRAVLPLVALALLAVSSAASAQTFRATLSGANERPNPNASTATGFTRATLTGNTLVVTGQFAGLTGNYAASHLHTGGPDVSGPVIFALTPAVNADQRGGTFAAAANTFTLTAAQVTALQTNGIYTNIHSSTFGGGEIRGQKLPLTTIAEARAAGVGATVTVQGTVSRAKGAFAQIQDATAGLSIRQTASPFFDAVAAGTIAPGTTITVTGVLSQFRGLLQINQGSMANDLTSFTVDGQGAPPARQVVTLAELAANGEQYESELVLVRNLTVTGPSPFTAATNYAVTDASSTTNAVSLRIIGANDTDVDGVAVPTPTADITGVVGQFDTAPAATVGYQIQPTLASDIAAGGSSAGEGAPTGGLTLAVANPVRGTTAVRFSVAEAADATLALYDVLGRRVAVLAEGAAVGERTATLATAGLAPGVYVLRLDAAGRSLTQTVTVVR